MLLEVRDLQVNYGNIQALHGISFSVDEGEIVTLIGANGAGKSTILMTISRQIPHVAELGGKVTGGSIMYEDEDLLQYAPHQVVSKFGISQVPEGRRIFGNLSVLENLKLATYARKDKAQIQKDFQRVFDIFPRLEERKHQRGETLSGGEQQMLAVGRALMTRGRLMLLDEPSMGLAPSWCGTFSKPLNTSTPRARPSCWWSRTRIWPSNWPAAGMCWKREKSSWKGHRRNWRPIQR